MSLIEMQGLQWPRKGPALFSHEPAATRTNHHVEADHEAKQWKAEPTDGEKQS